VIKTPRYRSKFLKVLYSFFLFVVLKRKRLQNSFLHLLILVNLELNVKWLKLISDLGGKTRLASGSPSPNPHVVLFIESCRVKS